MDNGSDLDYYTKEQLKCFPAFIKAEACTQYLDLRPNSQKIKKGKYEPRKIKDLKEEEVPGVILVQRTNTKDNSSTILEYKQKADFDKMVKENNKDAIKYFTISDEGKLVIAKWEHIKITVNGSYPDHLDDSEKDTPKDENIIRTEEIPYSEYIKKYTMPFEFLIQLLVVTEEPDFCMELVDHVLESKIVINIEEQETFSETTEEKNYKVHSKDEKRLDYNIKVGDNSVESGEEFLKKKKDDENKDCTNYATKDMTVIVNTQRTTHSYVFEILEADTWIAHYTKEYQKQNAKDDVSGPNSTDVKGEYKELEKKDIVDQSAISGDGDVQDFIGENKANYDQKIPDPINVTITSGTHDNGDKFKQIHYIHNGSVERVDGLVNGGTIYNEIKGEDGKGTGRYNLPISLAVVMKEVPATENTAKIPSITYVYVLNEAQTRYELQNTVNAEVIVTKLNIKEFEKIDLKVTTTTTTTNYPADPNPKTETHIYATKDGKPGKGHGDENTEYEKFLVAYDNNKNARDQINSIDSWLYEMMERESTVDFIDIVKYLLYMYDGKYRGVTELEGFEDIFNPDEMKSVKGNSSLDQYIKYVHCWEGGGEITKNAKGEDCYRVNSDGSQNGSAVGYGVDIGIHGAELRKLGYDTSIGSLIPVDVVDAIERQIREEHLNGVRAKTSGLNLKEYQIYALASRAYNCGLDGALSVERGSPQLNFVDSYKKYWNSSTDDLFESKNNNANFSHKLYTQYMSKPVTSDGEYLPGLENRRKSEWRLFQTGYYDLLDEWHAEAGNFLEVADQVHRDEMSWTYSTGGDLYWNNIEKSLNNPNKVTCCATYVSCVIYKAGYATETEMNSFNYNLCSTLYAFLEDKGWKVINSYNELEPGDVVFMNYGGGFDHVQIYAGNDTWYNAGSTDAIQKNSPYSQGTWARDNFYKAIRPSS